ncbi:MAG: hypothetical protein RLZZ293_1224 [Pseudomonadota bacterium]|jgi:superfamily II DNA or RNA helicase
MTDIVQVNYAKTGQSSQINQFGMREMQAKAFASRYSNYLLLKAPPASGKSRALMFIALDKLINQGLKKVIVAVPERSIGGSFAYAPLTKYGFFADWNPSDKYNLCTAGADGNLSKVSTFKEFMRNDEKILICTHATLRFAYDELADSDFNQILLAVDEFHHVSADAESRLGELLRNLMHNSTVQILAMTGSYFRGDSIPVLAPEDEAKFDKVSYSYYDQLNGYTYLQSLGIGYHFYQGLYTSAIMEVLDTNKKTILHIPHVNSGESTKDKHQEVDFILDQIGIIDYVDSQTNVIYLKRHQDGKIIKVADLVNDNPQQREKLVNYLRQITCPEDIDLIIALGMAKEGFDWPFCEHALTVGYRGSLTEIIQIIGRATRDSANKTHAQFTNLIAQPDVSDEQVKLSVNNMLKAITASLLMEQVLAPNFKFKTKLDNDNQDPETGTIKIKGFKMPSTKRVQAIIDSDLNDLKATILQDPQMLKAMPGNLQPEVINQVLIPKIIQAKYPELTTNEVDELSQYIVVDSVIKTGQIIQEGDKRFIKMATSFVNLEDLHINLINKINPFQQAFEILSKSVTKQVLRLIQETIDATKIEMSEAEALILADKLKYFLQHMGRQPEKSSTDPLERRLAELIIYLRDQKRKQINHG